MKFVQYFALSLVFLILLPGCNESSLLTPSFPLPKHSFQILLVSTDSWEASTGSLQRYEREQNSKGWKKAGDPISVSVGRSGLGWGRGLHTIPPDHSGPVKKEGDGKAPAGIFSLGCAFGYAPEPPPGVKIPYRQTTVSDYFVDDVSSPDYNRWIHLPGEITLAKDRWKSFEKMRRDDLLYEFGAVINHNTTPTEPGAGSAIFLHVWKAPGSPTAGCTAMSRENMIKLLTWLDPDKHPLLVQIPQNEIKKR